MGSEAHERIVLAAAAFRRELEVSCFPSSIDEAFSMTADHEPITIQKGAFVRVIKPMLDALKVIETTGPTPPIAPEGSPSTKDEGAQDHD